MRFQDFVTTTTGRTDVGDTAKNKGQCVGLVESWFDTMGLVHIWANACDMPDNADRGVFDVVLNTAAYVPPVGAAVVFPAGWGGSAVGHTALVAPGTNAAQLVVFEQNDRIGGGNGSCRLHTFEYGHGLTAGQVAAGWPKFIVPKTLVQDAPVVPTSAEGTFNVLTDLSGFVTAHAAAARENPAGTVQPGNYSIFSQAEGMVNVTSKPGQPGSWINPADNHVAAPAAGPEYDGNSVTVQPGWGLSEAAKAAGYPDFNSPLRWSNIAQLNGSSDWQTYNSQLKPGQRIVVGIYTPAAPVPQPARIVYSKLSEPLPLITKQQPTHVWQLDFATYAEARSAYDLPQAAPFVAYGKAQRTDLDRPAYFMTQEDFGNADTTNQPVNNRGINTIDLAPTPAGTEVLAAETVDASPAAPVSVTALPDLDKRYQYQPFEVPRHFVAVQLDDQIKDLQGTLPDRTLVPDQPIDIAGTMSVGGEKFYRTLSGVRAGTYYAVPTSDVAPVSGPNPLLRLSAKLAGLFAKLRSKS